MIELRDYQHEMLGRLESAWEKHRSVMVQMPTGTGKTVLLAEVIKRHTEGRSKGKVLIVAHRRELIEQIQQTLSAFEMRNEECGMRNDDYSEAESGVVVESIQKISRRIKNRAGNVSSAENVSTAEKVGRAELWRRLTGCCGRCGLRRGSWD